MVTTTEKDTMLDYIDTMADAIHIVRDQNISKSEREKLLREITDDLYNLRNYITGEVV